MNTVISGIEISSVNMEDRKGLGLKSGDTVRVHQKIEDKGKTRIQVFEGLVLARKHGSEAGATFTVRKVVDGIGVEKVFPLYSPLIDKIEITKRSTVRRAKLYFIREKVAREIRRQMRRMHLLNIATESEIEMKAKREAKETEEAKAKAKEEEEKKTKEAEAKAEEVVETAASEETPADAPVEEAKEDVSETSPEEDKKESNSPEVEEVKEDSKEVSEEDKKD